MWVPLSSNQKWLQKLMEVREAESDIPVPSRDVSFCVISLSVYPLFLHTPASEPVESQGWKFWVWAPLGKIWALSFACILHLWFELNSLLDTGCKAQEVFLIEQWKEPIRNVKS